MTFPPTMRVAMAAVILAVLPAAAQSTDRRVSPGPGAIAACVAQSQAGDRCVLNAGSYPEVVQPKSGTAIVAAAGAVAVIDGTDALDGWTPRGNDLWTRAYALPAGVPTPQVFIDGQPGHEARWPNAGADPIRPNWATMASGSTASVLLDPSLPAGDWVGATVHLLGGTDAYSHKTVAVVGSTAGRLRLSDPAAFDCPTYCAGAGALYYVFGVRAALDAPGEWLLKNGVMTLKMPPGESPNGGRVRAKARTVGIDLSAASGVTIRGVQLFATTLVTGPETSNDVIEGITARYVSEYDQLEYPGVSEPLVAHLADSVNQLAGTGHVLRNSIVDTSAGNGVVLLGTGITVENNLFRNIGYLGSYVSPILFYVGTDNTAWRNTVREASGYGIHGGWDGPHDGVRVAYNNVYDVMVTRVDGGGIYFCCSGFSTSRMRIDHNWVHGYAAPLPPFWGAGIYIDNGFGNGVTITQNVVDRPANNSESGLFANGTSPPPTGERNRFTFNTVRGGAGGADIAYDRQVRITVRNNRLPNGLGDYGGNTFAPGSPFESGPSGVGATDIGDDPGAAHIGCSFAGCATPP